ncbi:muscle, skeletal receptor tyrosine-protein kinase-like isoform X2 [Dysidea avara]
MNVTWTSLDHNILADPVMSIPTSFMFPTCPYRIFILYPCYTFLGQTEVKFVINAYTADKEYEQIVIFIGKKCGPDSPERFVGATEFPHDILPTLFNDTEPGCFVDTNPPTLNPPSTERSSTSSAPAAGIVVAVTIIPSVALMLIVLLVVLLIVWYHHLKVKERIANISIEAMARQFQFTNPLFDRVEAQQRSGPHEKEFPSEKIKFVRELGEGAFGRVYQGMATNIIEGENYTIVAVKQLKTDTTADNNKLGEFFKEVTFMSKLDHPRIVGLLGVCTITEPYCMIFEYMDLGDLNSYLRSAIGLGPDCDESEKETCFLQLSDLLHIVEQIAEGMEYLSNQGLVHRDLATRNCLVATGLEIKIADFGLSRDINSTDYYRVHGHAVLPIRWMAPESIMYGKFTMATDVWSFGVVMWEVFTYGQQPYVGLTNEEVITFITTNKTLEPPTGCPQQVIKIMTQCWSASPRSRPSFSKLHINIQQLSLTLKDVIYNPPDYPLVTYDDVLI